MAKVDLNAKVEKLKKDIAKVERVHKGTKQKIAEMEGIVKLAEMMGFETEGLSVVDAICMRESVLETMGLYLKKKESK